LESISLAAKKIGKGNKVFIYDMNEQNAFCLIMDDFVLRLPLLHWVVLLFKGY
jgi:peptide deformylase